MFGTAGLVRDRREMQKRERQQRCAAFEKTATKGIIATSTTTTTTSSKPQQQPQHSLRTIKFGTYSIQY